MPNYNKKGPLGHGPMTGRQMGSCTNYGANQKNRVKTESENSENENFKNLEGRGMANRWGRFFGLGRRGLSHGRGQGNRFAGENQFGDQQHNHGFGGRRRRNKMV